jgi:hypothetical protein
MPYSTSTDDDDDDDDNNNNNNNNNIKICLFPYIACSNGDIYQSHGVTGKKV